MAAPTPYTPSYDFSDFQTANPADPLPADQLDIQLAAIAAATVSADSAINNIRRSDGALVNAIVTPDSLSTTVVAMIGKFNPRGSWGTATAYAVNDLIVQSNTNYVCLTAHTSGVFATDLAAKKWMQIGASAGNAIATDGSSTVTADIPFAAHKLTGVATGVSGTDAVNLTQMTAAITAAAVPVADTTTQGKIEIATNAEFLAGTDTARATTAANAATIWAAGTDNTGGATITMGDGGSFNLITSTTAITAFAFTTDKAGRTARLKFATVRTLTHNGTSLIIPGAANVTTANGDTAEIESLGGGNFRVIRYTKADGSALVVSSSTTYTAVAVDTVATVSGATLDFTTAGHVATVPITSGFRQTVLNSDTTGDVTLTPAAGLVDGLATRKLRPGDRVTVVGDGTNLKTIGGDYGYDSGEQTITGAATLTLAHGFGVVPTQIEIWARCKTNDSGYVVGEEIMLAPINYAGVALQRAMSVRRDATNIKIVTGSAGFGYSNPSTGNEAVMTSANWKYIVRARAR